MDVVDHQLLLTYLIAVFVLEIVPGPDMLFALGSGIRAGPRAGLCAAVGCALGEAVHFTAAALGLTALFRASPVLYRGTAVAGAAYLVWLGTRAWRSGAAEGTSHRAAATAGRALGRGLVVNLLNPKMAMFTLTFLPQFVRPSRGHLVEQFVVLGAIFLVMEIGIDGAAGLAAGRISNLLRERKRANRWLNRLTGSLYLGLATTVVTEQWL
jgi:threonine/homoserine/homoserine lactone efflux protein